MHVGGACPDGQARWSSMSHNGVALAEPYVPHRVPVGWNGRQVVLPPDAEETLTEFVARGGRAGPAAHTAFWHDWSKLLPPGSPIKSLEGCDVEQLRDWLARTARMRRRDKARILAQQRLRFAYAWVDGHEQPIFPFAVDRPGIFWGRHADGVHAGRIRRRIRAADVTLNLGRDAPVPVPGWADSATASDADRRWARVEHNPQVDWVAKWHDPVTGRIKYARIALSAPHEQEATKTKFDMAQRMHAALPALDALIRRSLTSSDLGTAQLGACLWMIRWLGIRVGRHSDGCHGNMAFGATSLRPTHVRLLSDRSLRLDFPSKSGVRYLRTVQRLPPGVVRTVRDSQARREGGRAGSPNVRLFDLVSATTVNRALHRLLPGATAKVLRTCLVCAEFEGTLQAVLPSHGASDLPAAVLTRKAHLALTLAHARAALSCNHHKGCKSGADISTLAAELDQVVAQAAACWPCDAAGLQALSQHANAVIRRGCLSLSMSRSSYVDPRITVAFCRRTHLPLQAAFDAKTLSGRFAWAAGTPANNFTWRSTPGS